MEIGFIGLGNMGGPMSRRLVEAGHQVTVFDTRKEAMDKLTALGATAARSVSDVADRVETVMTSLPSLDIGFQVAAGENGLTRGNRIKRYVDLSTTGSRAAIKTAEVMKQRGIVQIDCPVSGGVGGAEKGTLAVMTSGPKEEVEAIRSALEVFGKVFYCGDKPGMAQSMKLANNFLSATGMAASSEAIAMGVKAGLDPSSDVRCDQRRQRHEHLDHAEVSALGAAGHLRLRFRHGADGEGRAAVPGRSRSPSASRSKWRRRSVGCGRRRLPSMVRSRISPNSQRRSRRVPACRCAPRNRSGACQSGACHER